MMRTTSSPHEYVTRRTKAALLRRLKAAPLAAWPQVMMECLSVLPTLGVCQPSALVAMLQTSLGVNGAAAARWPFSTAGHNAAETVISPQVQLIQQFICTHYGQRISLKTLALTVGRNTQYISTLFHRQTGVTIHNYLTSVRMEQAARLLRGSEKVEAVMLLVGYRSKKNFYKQFQSSFGMTPGCYKARHSEGRTPAV
jgi:AraC-like DNA-binding protein